MAIRQDFIESESDGVLYCHHALFVPLLTLLESLWGENIAFGIEAEPACHTVVESAGEEARGRLDVLIAAYKKGDEEPAYPILRYASEAKAPGTISPREWAAAYKTNINDDNAVAPDSASDTDLQGGRGYPKPPRQLLAYLKTAPEVHERIPVAPNRLWRQEWL